MDTAKAEDEGKVQSAEVKTAKALSFRVSKANRGISFGRSAMSGKPSAVYPGFSNWKDRDSLKKAL